MLLSVFVEVLLSACVCVCMFLTVYVCGSLFVGVCMFMLESSFMYLWLWLCVFVPVCACMYLCLCLYVHVFVVVCVCGSVCMYLWQCADVCTRESKAGKGAGKGQAGQVNVLPNKSGRNRATPLDWKRTGRFSAGEGQSESGRAGEVRAE